MKRGCVAGLCVMLVGLSFADGGVSLAYAPQGANQGQGQINGFIQEQYFASDRPSTSSGFFRNRRARLIYTYTADEKTMGRMSVEFAAGTNQTTAQIRNAFIQYRPGGLKSASGPTITVGAQSMPLGYEILYSTTSINWSERSIYEQTFFNSEDARGLLYQNGDSGNYWFVGVFDPLTVGDPEQTDVGTKGEVEPVYGLHGKKGAFEGGLSGLSGHRPAYSSGAINLAQTDRDFYYADLRYHPKDSHLDIRSEYMIGKDRIPLAAVAAANKVNGGHVNVDYHLTDSDTAVVRYETFDRNTDASGDIQTLYGVGYVKDLSRYLRLSAAADWNKNPNNPAGQTAYRTFTLRIQFKF